MKSFPVGKLKMEQLLRLLRRYNGAPDDAVIVGPEVGEDAAVIEIGEEFLVAKTDPITFATDRIGEYTIHVNANDIACMGGKPRWFLATVLLPEGNTDDYLIEGIFSQLSEACKGLGIAICGGHTEVTHGLERPIVVGQMLGIISKGGLIRSSGARPGDHILLTKGIAVEATSLLAREKEIELLSILDKNFIDRCKGFLDTPGISVLKEAEIATNIGGIHAMHDPTEGGIATGLHELAMSAGVGLEIWADSIGVFPETRAICEFFGLDPFGAIASGALVLAIEPSLSEKIMNAFRSEGIDCFYIGIIKEKSEGLIMIKNSRKLPLSRFDQDEISKVFQPEKCR